MNYYSPLRYPGGKGKIAGFIQRLCVENGVTARYVEPYAGGSAVALSLLLSNTVEKILINDYDRSVFAFWHSLLNKPENLCRMIEQTEISVQEWDKQRDIQRNKLHAELLELGFSTLFMNRVNRSGIIMGGIIGGRSQEGEYRMGCRFNKDDIISRIRAVASRKKDIELRNDDAVTLMEELSSGHDTNTLVYLDPPYFKKGSSLYMNHYRKEDHRRVAESVLKSGFKWVVSYDNVPEIKSLFPDVRSMEYSLSHSAGVQKTGDEILFFSDGLRVPDCESPTDIKFR